MSVVQKNPRPRLIPVPHNTRKPAATPQSIVRLAGNGGVMVVSVEPATPYVVGRFGPACGKGGVSTSGGMAVSQYQSWTFVDRNGGNFTYAQALEIVRRGTGASEHVLEYMRPGSVYQNGIIWFQRID